MTTSPALLPLHQVNWNSHTCECKVEVRRYHILKTSGTVIERGGALQFVPEYVFCQLHRLDGSVEDIPMRVTTIEEMLKSGLQTGYWQDARRRQLHQVGQVEQMLRDIEAEETPLDRADPAWLAHFDDDPKKAASAPGPRDLDGWGAVLESVRHGKTYADHEGYRRSPGTQTRGHLSHRCPRHHNQTSTSLMEQRAHKACGCVIGQITVGERREEGVNHERVYHLCEWHRAKRVWAA